MGEKVEAQTIKWVEDSSKYSPRIWRKRSRLKMKKEYVGWGSKQLINFLNSIGKRTEEKLSQHDVTSIINDYISDNKLIKPDNKKKVICDARLKEIFGKSTIMRIKIFELLESHYAENELSSDDEDYSSDEREADKRVDLKPEKVSTSVEKAHKRKKACEAPKSCFAAIIPENIRVVYLKKTLVEELLKDPENFEIKLLGSFVRVKADRYDYAQKNSHVLQLVTGINNDAADGNNVRLAISDMEKHIDISELSDVNFSEDECKDLHRRIKAGFLKHPTVAELQEKVQALHKDITNHWLPKEINRLERLMDRANEKGWRGEFFEFREKRKLLQTSEEQSRLLEKVPEIIAEALKLDSEPEITKDCIEKTTTDPPRVTDWVIANDPPNNGGAATADDADLKAKEAEGLEVDTEAKIQSEPPKVEVECVVEKPAFETFENGHLLSFDLNEINTGGGSSVKQTVLIDLNQSIEVNGINKGGSSTKQVEVIDLSDEDEEEEAEDETCVEERDCWHYRDPNGKVQGPFSLLCLKRWSDMEYFPAGFKVWKSGKRQPQDVLLSELVSRIFPH